MTRKREKYQVSKLFEVLSGGCRSRQNPPASRERWRAASPAGRSRSGGPLLWLAKRKRRRLPLGPWVLADFPGPAPVPGELRTVQKWNELSTGDRGQPVGQRCGIELVPVRRRKCRRSARARRRAGQCRRRCRGADRSAYRKRVSALRRPPLARSGRVVRVAALPAQRVASDPGEQRSASGGGVPLRAHGPSGRRGGDDAALPATLGRPALPVRLCIGPCTGGRADLRHHGRGVDGQAGRDRVVGGDWYDVIPTGDEVALIVGDVEGTTSPPRPPWASCAARCGPTPPPATGRPTSSPTPTGSTWTSTRRSSQAAAAPARRTGRDPGCARRPSTRHRHSGTLSGVGAAPRTRVDPGPVHGRTGREACIGHRFRRPPTPGVAGPRNGDRLEDLADALLRDACRSADRVDDIARLLTEYAPAPRTATLSVSSASAFPAVRAGRRVLPDIGSSENRREGR